MTETKKNRKATLILLLVLLVAITSAFVGTLAKYMTSETVSDDTVVAKFGLNIPNSIDLFSDSYSNVKSDTDGKMIIAPGTSGHYNFAVTGTSEVAYTVSADITVTYSEEWDDYEPLKFSINGDDWTDLEDFKGNLSTALASNTMAPNETYSNAQTIYWRWPFHVSPENDIKDTAMGRLAVGGTAPQVTVNIEVTAAQVD